MSRAPLMPKATAVWLVENTALTFRQIADFAGLHELEVKGIADGDVAQGIKGLDPVTGGQLTREEIEKGEKNQDYRLKLLEPKVNIAVQKSTKGPRYTPVSKRGDRPDAIAWLLRYHPELPDSQVMKLVGTTKTTIAAIRDRTHWNAPNIKPVDPVSLGLCSQIDLDFAVQKAARKAGRGIVPDAEPVRTLIPAAAAVVPPATPAEPEPQAKKPQEEEYDADSVFAKLKGLKAPSEDE
ncbi:DUF1013 domain-containing protein [Taklimakanibacter lacteus]|uniref:DUF1013 domain-containing protein n=1 Tax=Taklimakanibacter lacteus TaxID=2268456 RepID=UPI000E664DBD